MNKKGHEWPSNENGLLLYIVFVERIPLVLDGGKSQLPVPGWICRCGWNRCHFEVSCCIS